MEKVVLILRDVIIFGLTALFGAVLGFSNLGGATALAGKVVCCISMVLVALSLVVNRSPRT